MPDDETVWRVGYFEAPLAFKPEERRSWDHRYDDSRREFGSLYCAQDPLTAFREVLQELRPNAKAIAEYVALFGSDEDLPRNAVSWAWRSQNVLARATLSAELTEFADLQSAASRAQIERDQADVLTEHGVTHLDVTDTTSKDRRFTQALARALFDAGAVGVRFASNLDGGSCLALFEGRAELYPNDEHGDAVLLAEDVPAMLQVCEEWNLAIEAQPGEPGGAPIEGDPA